MHAKELEARGHRPVHQRGLFQVTKAVVDVQRDPVVAGRHLARRLRVDRIGVVQQGRLEEAAEVNDCPNQYDERKKKVASRRG